MKSSVVRGRWSVAVATDHRQQTTDKFISALMHIKNIKHFNLSSAPSSYQSNQHVFFPAEFDELNPVQTAVAQIEFGVGRFNVQWRRTDGPIFSEVFIAFSLDYPGAGYIGRHRISAYDQTAVWPGVLATEMMRSHAVK